MGKESKIGIIVVGVLMGAFLGLLIKRFVLTPSVPAMESDPSHLAAQPEPIPAGDKPTVVTAQRDAPGRSAVGAANNAWDNGRRADSGADVPHGSFLPADEPPVNPRYAEQPVNPRYAEPSQPTPADEPTGEPTPAVDPFHQRFVGEKVAGDAQSPAPGAAPNEIDVTTDKAEALDARKPPPRATRNPLRRLSAEVPIDDGQPDGDVVAPENLNLDLEAPGSAGESDDFDRSGTGPAGGDDDVLGLQPATAPHIADDPSAGDREIQPATDDPLDTVPPSGGDPFGSQAPRQYPTPADDARFGAADAPRAVAPQPALPADGRYTVQPNDSLWTISQKVYGDGRYYKAIGEHNRRNLPQPDRLTAGTVLDVPATSVLAQNYPSLCPRQRRSAVVPSGTVPASAQQSLPAGGDVYVVAEGDTLMDIARYELGKAARWGEIFDLNRDKLGEDFDFLQPGLELRLPPKTPADAIGRPAVDRYQR